MILITYVLPALAHLVCIALGIAIHRLWRTVRRPYDSRPVIAPRAELPPATARKIARARRRNRPDLRAVSIRRTHWTPGGTTKHGPWCRCAACAPREPRTEPLPPSLDDFDTEATRP